MAGVNFTFDLGPVSGLSTQHASSSALETTGTSVGTQFQSAQNSVVAASGSGHASLASSACNGGCFVVHSDGPGVTTLSIGEEDGGAGEYLALPMVDGSQFLEPPVQSFASAGDFGISTLAIGEEDGATAVASVEIGATQPPISNVIEYVEQTTLDPIPVAQTAFFDGVESAQVSENYGVMDPIYSIGDTVEVPTQVASAYAPYEPQAAAVETIPITNQEIAPSEALAMSPRFKPAFVASAGSPLPDIKPATALNPDLDGSPTPVAGNKPASPDGNFVSVGDYDSYIASIGEVESAPAAPAPAPSTIEPTSITDETRPSPSDIPTVPQPAITIPESSESIGADHVSFAPVSDPVRETVGSIATTPIEVTTAPEPVYVIQGAATENTASQTPQAMEAASITLSGPATAQPEPVYTMNSPKVDAGTSDLTRGTTFSSVEAPVPLEKPSIAAADAPRLSEEDYRITTLALGEEEAGGG